MPCPISQATRFRRCGAFTLIELLVVISIIALLIALLLPALSSARQTARNTQDMSNIRQMGMAMVSYATDRDGELPRGEPPTIARSLVGFRMSSGGN